MPDLEKLLDTDIGGFSLGNLLASVVIFLVSLIIIKLLMKAIKKALDRSKLERAIRSFILSCARVLLWVLVALIIADKLSIPSASLVAVLSVAGLAFSLSLQNTLSNVFAGFTLLMTRPFSSGDFVELGTTTGTVISSGLFYVSLVIMILSFIISCIVFEDVLELQDKKFDVVSFVESIVAFGGVTLGIGNLSTFGILSIEAGVPLLLGAVVCVFFVTRQCRLEKPFLDVKILVNRNYAVSVISSMVLYLVMMGSSVMMPLYVQSVMGYSAVVSGLVTLPGSLATALVSPFAGKLYDEIGIKKIFVAGAAALVISNIGMFFLSMETPLWTAAALNVIRNISIGSLMMPLLTWGTSNVHPTKMADASSLLTSLRTIAGSIGSAVFVGIMTMVAASSAETYGDNAMMHGMNMSFFWMAVGAAVLLLIAVFAVREKR